MGRQNLGLAIQVRERGWDSADTTLKASGLRVRAERWHVIERLKTKRQSILLIAKTVPVLKRLADRHFVFDQPSVWRSPGRSAIRWKNQQDRSA